MKAVLGLSAVLVAVVFSPCFASAEEASWVDRITFKGDIRLRYEGIDEEFAEDRNRMRFRSRLGISAEVNDDVKFVLQLATGGGNPVSTNQTFDNGFATKDIGVDLAYVDWQINDKLNLYGGKIKNPQYRAGGVPLLWDSDLSLEGVALKFTHGGFFGTLGGYSVEERSSADDSLLFTFQTGYTFVVTNNVSLTAGAGYLEYTNTVGNSAFYNGRAKGNTLDASGNYVNEYKDTELFVQLDAELGGWPIIVYVHAVQNNEVSEQDQGFALGAKLGSAKADGDMEFSWTWQDIEADAVVGTFNDSDFAGGGSDSDGHLLKAKYAYNKNVFFGGTMFLNEKDRFHGNGVDYNRIQIDVEFKFN